MLRTKFQASEETGSGEDFLKFFLCISILQTQNPLRGHFGL